MTIQQSKLSAFLDSGPQIPSDYANHIIQGGLGGLIISLLCLVAHLPFPWIIGPALVFAGTAVKKYQDYGRETLSMCVWKTILTPLWGYILLAVTTLNC